MYFYNRGNSLQKTKPYNENNGISPPNDFKRNNFMPNYNNDVGNANGKKNNDNIFYTRENNKNISNQNRYHYYNNGLGDPSMKIRNDNNYLNYKGHSSDNKKINSKYLYNNKQNNENISRKENINININDNNRIKNYNQDYHKRERYHFNRNQNINNDDLGEGDFKINNRPQSSDYKYNNMNYQNEILYNKSNNNCKFITENEVDEIKKSQKSNELNNKYDQFNHIKGNNNKMDIYQKEMYDIFNSNKNNNHNHNHIIRNNNNDSKNNSNNGIYNIKNENNKPPIVNKFRKGNRNQNKNNQMIKNNKIVNMRIIREENIRNENLDRKNIPNNYPVKIKIFEEFNSNKRKEINNINNPIYKEEHKIFGEYQKEKSSNMESNYKMDRKPKQRSVSHNNQRNHEVVNKYLGNNNQEEQNTMKKMEEYNLGRQNKFQGVNINNENKVNRNNQRENPPNKYDNNVLNHQNNIDQINTKMVLNNKNIQNKNDILKEYRKDVNSDDTKKIIYQIDKQNNNMQNNHQFNNKIQNVKNNFNNNFVNHNMNINNNRNMNVNNNWNMNINNNNINQNIIPQNNFNNRNNMGRFASPMPNNNINMNMNNNNKQINNINANNINKNQMFQGRGFSAGNRQQNNRMNLNNINNNFNNNNNFNPNQNFNQNNPWQNGFQNNFQMNPQILNKNIVQFPNNNLGNNNLQVFNNNANNANNARFNNFINNQNFNNNNNFSPIKNNNNGFIQNNNNFNNFGMNMNPNMNMFQNKNMINNQNFGFNQNMLFYNQENPGINQMQFNQQNGNRPPSPPHLPRHNYIINKIHANGLQNIGATCYMNATLQCLAHVEDFTKYLLQNKANIKKDKYRKKLSNAFVEVLENIWENNIITYYAPNNFKNLISEMNPLFAGIQANDSKDLVLFILETMHNELNAAKNVNQNNFEIIDQYNFENSLVSFMKSFKDNFRSVVSDIFYGMYNSRMQCHNCRIITHNIQCFNILIMPLEEVRKFKNRYQNWVTLRECFEYYQKSDFMFGENQIYCNYCKKMSTSENNTTLIVGPKLLILNLNRGKGLQFNVSISFDEYINISDFIYYNNTNVNYRLIGVVTHFGPSGESGHFIAFCKSFVDGNWYRYNDAMVNLSSFNDVKNTGVPYILFYAAYSIKT